MLDTAGLRDSDDIVEREGVRRAAAEMARADRVLFVIDSSDDPLGRAFEEASAHLPPDVPVSLLFNKIDLYSHVKKDEDDLTPVQKENLTLKDLENTWMAKNHLPSIFISATEKTNLDMLKDMIFGEVLKIRKLRYPSLS